MTLLSLSFYLPKCQSAQYKAMLLSKSSGWMCFEVCNLLGAECPQVRVLGAEESASCGKCCTKAKLKLEIWPDSVESHFTHVLPADSD